MGNLINTLKKFVANKNTVTILAVIAGLVVLWIFYNYRVNNAIDPVKVPYANKPISATSIITQEDFDYIEVSRKFLKGVNVITDPSQLIGYYVNVGTSIPEGGLFYRSQIVESKDLPDSLYSDLPEGYTAYLLKVDNKTTIGNSIYDGDYVDIYVSYKSTANSDITVIGPLIEHIKVLGVMDSQNKRVFDDNSSRTPAYLAFGVNEEQFTLLHGAEAISRLEMFPVPRGKYYTENEGETLVGSQNIIDYINSVTMLEKSDNAVNAANE